MARTAGACSTGAATVETKPLGAYDKKGRIFAKKERSSRAGGLCLCSSSCSSFFLPEQARQARGGEEEEDEGPDRCINQRRGADGSLNFRIGTAARGRGGSKKGRGVKGREGSRGRPEPEEGGGWDWTADWEWEKRESQAKPQPQPFCKADAPGFAAFFTFYLFIYLFSVCFLL